MSFIGNTGLFSKSKSINLEDLQTDESSKKQESLQEIIEKPLDYSKGTKESEIDLKRFTAIKIKKEGKELSNSSTDLDNVKKLLEKNQLVKAAKAAFDIKDKSTQQKAYVLITEHCIENDLLDYAKLAASKIENKTKKFLYIYKIESAVASQSLYSGNQVFRGGK